MAGPFLSPPTRNFVGSPMGAVPKKRSNPLKYRVIHDLSWPRGHYVNDFIPAERFRCQYDTLDRAISLLKQAGQGAMMAKLDLPDAYGISWSAQRTGSSSAPPGQSTSMVN